MNGSSTLRTRAEQDLKQLAENLADAQTQPSVPVPAPVMDVETVEPVPKKKMLSRLEEQRAARVKVAAGGDGGSGGAGRQAPVTGRRVLISERC